MAVALSLTGIFRPLPKQVVAAALIGYTIIAAFYAWREQYHAAARREKNPVMAAYDGLDELVKQGHEMLERLKNAEPRLPTKSEFEKWNKRLITLAESCATIVERNRLRGGSVLEVGGEEIMNVYVHVAKEHYDTAEKLVSKLKIAREIMERLQIEQS